MLEDDAFLECDRTLEMWDEDTDLMLLIAGLFPIIGSGWRWL